MLNNPIQSRIETFAGKWIVAIEKEERIIRIKSDDEERSMINAFFKYLLGVDVPIDCFVFVLDTFFEDIDTFSEDLLEDIEEEIDNWNNAKFPSTMPYEKINWKIDNKNTKENNRAAIFSKNINTLYKLFYPENESKMCFVIRMHGAEKQEAESWLNDLLATNLNKQIKICISDTKKHTLFDRLAEKSNVHTISPNFDMSGAIEELSNMGDPAKTSTQYRIVLNKLIRAVKERNDKEIDLNAKKCLEITMLEIDKDPNWLSQTITIYTLLYTDQIGKKNLDRALFFAHKATETALHTVGLLDSSISFRLVGQSHIAKGTLLFQKTKYKEALENFIIAKKAYQNCNDFLMQIESSRLCGWAAEECMPKNNATDFYIEGYHLYPNLTKEMARNSTFPFIAKKLMYNEHRSKKISDEKMNNQMTNLFGSDWKEIVNSYGKIN